MKGKSSIIKESIIWSSNLAYAIGLISTDGCLSPDGRHIIFISKDIDLIKTFKRCLGLSNKITPKTSGYSKKIYHKIQFGNVQFYRWLLKIGLMPNKTKIIGKLHLPNKYLPDFLRGHLDGDGYVRAFQDPVYSNSKRLYTTFHSASLKHLKWIQKRLNQHKGIQGWIEYSTRVWRLTYAKSESKVLLPFLYYDKNIPCLKRKRNIIESFL